MKNKKALVVLSLAFILSVVAIQCFRPPSETGAVEVGQAAPPFKLQALNGKEVSLEQYKGKIVILDFWATWCGPCRKSMPIMDKLQEEYSGKLSVLAVNLQETKDIVTDYVLDKNVHTQVLLDKDGSIGARYGAESIPTQVLIDQEGIVRDVMEGVYPIDYIRAAINKLM